MPASSEIIAHIDGGSRGNPGPAAFGVTIETAQGETVEAFGTYIGTTTNNVAEYRGLLAALDYALSHGYARLRVFTDSELLARQMTGQYKVRSPELKPLHDQARAMIVRLESFSIRHVYREQNREADRLANEAMDKAGRGAGKPISPVLAPQERVPAADGSAQSSPAAQPKPGRVVATFQDGVLRPHTELALLNGEEVELEIRRRQ